LAQFLHSVELGICDMIYRERRGNCHCEVGRSTEEKMQFYNLKTRSHVDIPDSDVKKKKMVRQTKSGEQVRYALTADYNGTALFKFVSEAVYKSSNAKEV